MRFHETVHGVYFDDLDAVNNPDQYHLVRANTIAYDRAVRGVGQVRCRIWVEKLGVSSLVIGFSVLPLDEDRPFAQGTRTLVRVDPATQRPTAWTAEFRQRIGPYTRSE